MNIVLAVLVLAVVAPAATPAPPPPTIIRERVSPVCTTLHQLVLPLAEMNIKNALVFNAIRGAAAKWRTSRGTYLGDGNFLYGSRIDNLYTYILANITKFDQLMNRSYQTYPQGTNAKVDALRQRVQNVIDLERLLANQNIAAYASAVDNDGITGIENSLNQMVGARTDPHAPATPLPSDLPAATPPPLPDESEPAAIPGVTADRDPKLASSPPPAFAMRTLKWSKLAELQSLMHREGPALQAQALVAAHDCDGV